MNVQIKNSYQILGINNKTVSKEALRKCYFKEALKYHPDKNNSTDSKERFHKIHESYEVLMKHHGYMEDDTYTLGYNEEKTPEDIPNYANVIYSFLKPILNTELFQDIQLNTLIKIIENIKSKCEDKAINILEKLNIKKCNCIYILLKNNKEILNIPSSFIDKVKELYESKISKDEVIRIFPSINDLLVDNLYKLNENDKEYLIPLWHNELVYDNNGAELYVQCIPKLDENVCIDDYNNIHIYKKYLLDELWKMKNICIQIGNKLLTIEKSSLKLIPKQMIPLSNIGISRINSNNIYDISKRGSINIHIHIID